MFGASNFLLPNGTFFAELIAFLIVVGILGWKIIPPINDALEKRQNEIQSTIEEAESMKIEAERTRNLAKDELESAKKEARSIIAKANETAVQLKEEAQARGQEEYERILESARLEIERERERAREELLKEMGNLVIKAAEKVIGSSLTSDDQNRLVEEAISGIESSN